MVGDALSGHHNQITADLGSVAICDRPFYAGKENISCLSFVDTERVLSIPTNINSIILHKNYCQDEEIYGILGPRVFRHARPSFGTEIQAERQKEVNV